MYRVNQDPEDRLIADSLERMACGYHERTTGATRLYRTGALCAHTPSPRPASAVALAPILLFRMG